MRPGPIQGDMVHPYLRRRSGKEKVEYPSHRAGAWAGGRTCVRCSSKTMGVPLFQEQAMKLAIVAAKFTPGGGQWSAPRDGDVPQSRARSTCSGRRWSAAWRRAAMSQDFAERCFKQIKGFGSYGFPESHAASFAMLVYISAWIKRHHPAAFACALLNSQPMGFYAPARDRARCARAWRRGAPRRREFQRNGTTRWSAAMTARWPASRLPADRRLQRGMGGRLIVCARQRLFRREDLRAARAAAEARARHSCGSRQFPVDRHGPPRNAMGGAPRCRRRRPAACLPRNSSRSNRPKTIAPLPLMPLSEHVLADYQMLRLSLRGHLMQFLRETFPFAKAS